ncbi:MAG: peptidylprolyl isomerase [Nanoarchaeota archaeon]|nr:peptidylprolyl isomerase [Nanoarchaeota archaeon]
MKKIIFILLLLTLIVGCSSNNIIVDEEVSEEVVGDEQMEYEAEVLVETNQGSFTISLYKDTPITTANFLKLVREGFYDGLTFHRYEPGFVIQGGDPNGDGTGGSDDTIKLEVIGLEHSKGTVGMARSSEPDSASSQFFVNLVDNNFLDDGYAVFGDVTEGMAVAEKLRVGDTMTKVTVQE